MEIKKVIFSVKFSNEGDNQVVMELGTNGNKEVYHLNKNEGLIKDFDDIIKQLRNKGIKGEKWFQIKLY